MTHLANAETVKTILSLDQVDNTSDINKPVSTVNQTNLDLKSALANPVFTGTVSGITKSMVGLGSVDNTSDSAKPVSTIQQTALNLKAPLASPTFTGTVVGITSAMVGLGNCNNTADSAKPVSTAQQTALDLKANLAGPTFSGTVGGITKSMVGLGSVDNTTDTAKPVSTVQQSALDLKANLISPSFTTPALGTPSSGVATNLTGTASGLTSGNVTTNANLTGDVTSVGNAATIPNDTVTYAKMQNVSATDKVLGRSSSGAGDMEEIICTSAGRALIDDVDSSAQRTTLGLGTLATQSGTFSGTSSGTNSGDQTITLTGNVTGSGTGSFAATIANAAVTYAKIQNILATDKLLGRVTAGAGSVEEITCTSAGRNLIDDVDTAAQRTTLGLGTLATQSGTFSGTSSGTNTGDQTSVSGNAGTVTTNANLTGVITSVGNTTNITSQTGTGSKFVVDNGPTLIAPLLGTPASGVLTNCSGTAASLTAGNVTTNANMTGDITSSGSNATTIANNVVTLAKMATMATASILGRNTASTGNVEVLSASTTKTLLSLDLVNNTADTAKPVSTVQQTALDLKANLAGPTFTGTVNGITKTMVGLTNTDNTSDATRLGVYKTVFHTSGSHIAAKIAGTYALSTGQPLSVSGTGTLYPIDLFYLDTTEFASISGLTAKLRLEMIVSCNDVAPTGNFTLGLYPITRPATSGGAGLCIYTLGTVVSGSNGATVATPAADSTARFTGSDFSVPTSGVYCLGVVTTATIATSALVQINAMMKTRYV